MELSQPCGELVGICTLEIAVLTIPRTIYDIDGPKIADDFYENLCKNNGFSATETSRPDSSQAARALHLAVTKLRAEGVSFARWLPFIHLGQ